MCAPAFWTVKMLFLRLSEDKYNFNLFDLANDTQIYMNIVATALYLAYIYQNDFKANELMEGSITAVFFILGDLFRSMAFRYGPGGPISALVGTEVIYQTAINAIFFDQGLSHFQYYGISAGILANIVITMGDKIFGCLMGSSKK